MLKARKLPYILAIGGGGSLGGTGTLSALTLDYPDPNDSNPTSILIGPIPADYQAGASGSPIDSIKLAYSSSPDMSSPTILEHVLVDGVDVPGGSFSFPLPTGTPGTPIYFIAFGSHLGTDSQYLSNIVAWGSSAAPTISTSATQSHNELTQYAVAITANVPISTLPDAVRISGDADQAQFEVFQDGSGNWFYRPYANGTFDADNPVSISGTNAYLLAITVTSIFGNTATIHITDTIQHVSKTVTLTPSSFTGKTGATDGASYQTVETLTVSGLATGISVPVAVSGAGFSYIKNSGSPSTAATTATNGDTFAMVGSTSGGTSTGTLTFGTSPHQVAVTFSVGDNAVALSATNKNGSITLSGSPATGFSSSSSNGSHQMVSADTAKSGGIRQWEITINSHSGTTPQVAFGMFPGSVDFTTNPSPEPGRGGQPNGFIWFGGTGSYFSDYNGATTGSSASIGFSDGDTYTVIWDSVGHTIKVVRTRSGTPTTLVTATGVTDTTLTPFVGADAYGINANVNFGASAFVYPLSNTPDAVAFQS